MQIGEESFRRETEFPAPPPECSFDSRFAIDVLVGLSGSPKTLQSKYLYDVEGSRLFQKIMELPEYYLTRCEFEILSSYRHRLVKILSGTPFHLIELGAGDGTKTSLLIDCFLKGRMRFRYFPIDICRESIHSLVQEFGSSYPSLYVEGLICEYSEGLKWLSDLSRNDGWVNLVLFLGSNIGNLKSSDAMAFMHTLWKSLNPGDYVLIGFDLKKEISLLNRAYDDSQGVTARFNLNILNRINRELGGDFDLSRFNYASHYNVHSGAVESFLISLVEQKVHIGDLKQSISFKAWEPVQTEFSYKYLKSEVEEMAFDTGFIPVEHALDSRGFFMDSLWQVRKP
ncbi:MAG: L-histidine N(alpha)-methyltransferase [Desulfobacteraceae bacterium]|nr:MAG: L-histidine N(alpha)-methyltransferase [Desulfobacteraceae bacterium]